ncbi:DUF3261 domain-containing protein [Shewanella sp. D64]|uniref:DUF3261 domain-containing protein n=1 Tax=unclassified Shewanella TaxID=196818 RepID=UPI0022BA2CFB|nr:MULTISPECIES: DUF3261 domain-containing protein [unclassified Shewanella]MEC4726860.1 DUF3261 domain-containing protein [Shewanella sp. D64]MEC4739028.1 DUF3261 domain-containing protein [Shewanella sp. E94]WBJ95888.1 DUF3261 domain-containing protein [Shewanella sp. MTB7]
MSNLRDLYIQAKKWPTLIALLIIFTTACSHTLQRQTCVALASDVSYCLAPIPAADQIRSITQQVSIQVDGAHHELLTQLELDKLNLTLVGLAPLGQALFTLTYDGTSLSSQQSMLLGDEFKAEYLLALIQLAYWPVEDVNLHLQGASFIEQACNAAQCRTLYASETEDIMQISYDQQDPWQAEINLAIPSAKFKLKITPI